MTGAADVEAVVAKLEEIEADACQHLPLLEHDGLACFDYLYTIITKHIWRCLSDADPTPAFADNEFMAVFDVAFAERYLNAVGFGKKVDWQPTCWKLLLDRREAPHISPLIFAVAGVNAHVNFDLPFAVVAACAEMGQELDSGTHHEDYDRINQIFAKHMQELRQHFEDNFQRGFDKSWVSRTENWLGNRVVVRARKAAWSKAVELWEVHDDQAKLDQLARSRDRRVAMLTWGLFQLDHLPSMVFRAMHLVPGPPRTAAAKGLSRTGWPAKKQNTPTPG